MTGETKLPPKAGWQFPILLFIWFASIFGTSCTVVQPEELFRLVARISGASLESMEWFELLWGVSWFAIVKGWHFTEFAILTLLTATAIKWWEGKMTVWTVVASMVLCVAFAVSDEWHQTFVPDRFGTFQDVMIDSLGVVAAGSIMLVRQLRTASASIVQQPPSSS